MGAYIYHEIEDGPMTGLQLKIYIEGYIYEATEPENGFLGGLGFECDNLRSVLRLGTREFEPRRFNYFPFLDEIIEHRSADLAQALEEEERLKIEAYGDYLYHSRKESQGVMRNGR